MAGEDDAHTAGRQIAQRLGQRLDGQGIETGEGLVEHGDLGIVDEGGGELNSLLIAVAQLLELGVGTVAQSEPLQPAQGGVGGRTPSQAGEASEVGELLVDPHLRVETALLGHVAEPEPICRCHRRPVPGDTAVVGINEPEDAPHRRRLAGSVRAEKADDPPGRHVETGAVEGDDIAVPFHETLERERDAPPHSIVPTALHR